MFTLNKRVIDKARGFMRSWVKTNWDLVPGLCEIREPNDGQAIVDFDVENPGRNILFDAFMKKVTVTFRLTKNEHGTFLWGLVVNFQFKAGGGNGWTHPRNFKLIEGNFIEMPEGG